MPCVSSWKVHAPRPSRSCMGQGHVRSVQRPAPGGNLHSCYWRPSQGHPAHMQSAEALLLLAPCPCPCMHGGGGGVPLQGLMMLVVGQNSCRQSWPCEQAVPPSPCICHLGVVRASISAQFTAAAPWRPQAGAARDDLKWAQGAACSNSSLICAQRVSLDWGPRWWTAAAAALLCMPQLCHCRTYTAEPPISIESSTGKRGTGIADLKAEQAILAAKQKCWKGTTPSQLSTGACLTVQSRPP